MFSRKHDFGDVLTKHREGLKLSKLSDDELRKHVRSKNHTIEERAAALGFIMWAAVIVFVILAYFLTGCTHKGIDYTLELQMCTGQYQQRGECGTVTLAPSAYEEE